MAGCCVRGCKHTGADGYSMFRLPKRRRSEWLRRCKLPETTPLNVRICEAHFDVDDFFIDNGVLKLKSTAKPRHVKPNLTSRIERKVLSVYEADSVDDDGQVKCVLKSSTVVKVIDTSAAPCNIVQRDPLKDITVSLSGNAIKEIDARMKCLEDDNLRLRLEVALLGLAVDAERCGQH